MKIKSFLAGMLALTMFASCSNDAIEDGGIAPVPGGNDAGVYMSVLVSMPSAKGSRSFTDGSEGGSNTGTEIGRPTENKVSSLLLVLAKPGDNAYIAHSFVDNNLTALNQGDHYTATGKITKSTLAEYYNTNPTNHEVNVYVFCNPTTTLVSLFNDSKPVPADWYNTVCEIKEGESVWSDNNFLMSNNAIAHRELPKNLDDWNAFTTEGNPFNLSGVNTVSGSTIDNKSDRGAIKVERSVARFDFRDGSRDNYSELPANTYPVVRTLNADGTKGDFIVNITLNKMALVNMNNKFYYLRRVSADGTDLNSQLCMPELPWYTDSNGKPVPGLTGNYVVDAYAAQKAAGNITTGFSSYFNYPFFDDKGIVDNTESNNRWYVTRLDEVLSNGLDDNTDSWNAGGEYNRYKTWRYVTENTIPGATNQLNGVTTGVVFKGKMVATEALLNSTDEADQQLTAAISNKDGQLGNTNTDPILYQFGGHLYCTWPNLRKRAIKESYNETTKEWNRTNTLYKAVFGDGGTGESYDPMTSLDEDSPNYFWNKWKPEGKTQDDNYIPQFKAAATAAGITIYQSSNDAQDGWGYYCYYYYWNRHNDNLVPGEMGPMEFAVVRNNVYKLAVTKIGQLGHPRISENDPDDPKPDTPDEKGDVYMTVECHVLPWVVRVNNIEF